MKYTLPVPRNDIFVEIRFLVSNSENKFDAGNQKAKDPLKQGRNNFSGFQIIRAGDYLISHTDKYFFFK